VKEWNWATYWPRASSYQTVDREVSSKGLMEARLDWYFWDSPLRSRRRSGSVRPTGYSPTESYRSTIPTLSARQRRTQLNVPQTETNETRTNDPKENEQNQCADVPFPVTALQKHPHCGLKKTRKTKTASYISPGPFKKHSPSGFPTEANLKSPLLRKFLYYEQLPVDIGAS
jgi:hypothetical protein